MSKLEKSTCKIEVEMNDGKLMKGTAFFIAEDTLLTCFHVVTNDSLKINLHFCDNQNNEELTAEIIDYCEECDYALLKLNGEFRNGHYLDLCNSEIVPETAISIFGYPDDEQGTIVGESLNGKIDRFIEGKELVQDVILNIKDFVVTSKYSAFSGSPVTNYYGQVTSILKFQSTRGLSSVSVKKAMIFLNKNDIKVKSDELDSFDIYCGSPFLGFESSQEDCELHSQTPLKILTPKIILEANKGEIFYPNKNQEIEELIKFLKKTTDVNSKLWTGWIQLLTYVEILKGDYKDPKKISIEITTNELFKQFGFINKTKEVNLILNLNFYFTEESSYFKIAKRSIHENYKKEGISNTCNIFNSSINEFGNLKNVKVDISNPAGSGPAIPKIKIGTLSLSQLNREVKSSSSLQEVSDNLKKIFDDAIK